MIFNSLQFAIFLPIVFAIYWLLRENLKLQNLFVVVASYVFYGWWDYRFLFLIALTSLCSWGSGLLIAKEKENEGLRTEDKGLRSKGWLIANIVLNLGILAVFKYFNFFVATKKLKYLNTANMPKLRTILAINHPLLLNPLSSVLNPSFSFSLAISSPEPQEQRLVSAMRKRKR